MPPRLGRLLGSLTGLWMLAMFTVKLLLSCLKKAITSSGQK